MAKFYISYMDKYDNMCHVSIRADTKEDAEVALSYKYYDVDRIISITKERTLCY